MDFPLMFSQIQIELSKISIYHIKEGSTSFLQNLSILGPSDWT